MNSKHICITCKQQFRYIGSEPTISKFKEYSLPEYGLGCECLSNGSDLMTHKTNVWVYGTLREYEALRSRKLLELLQGSQNGNP